MLGTNPSDLLEQRLAAIFSDQEADLTLQGTVGVERLPSSSKRTPSPLSYFIQKAEEGSVSAQITVYFEADKQEVDLELSIKKFLRPTLSLSSAHIAVLIHQLRRSLTQVIIPGHVENGLTWEINRAQRICKLVRPLPISDQQLASLFLQMINLIAELNKLSIEILYEEADYYCAIERWDHARRAYLTIGVVNPLSFDQLQRFLVVLQRLKDWQGCVTLLEEGALRFGGASGAKLSYAACVIYRDILHDPNKAISACSVACELAPEIVQYQELLNELEYPEQAEQEEQATQSLELQSTSETIAQQEAHSFTENEEGDAFFDDLTGDEPISSPDPDQTSSHPSESQTELSTTQVDQGVVSEEDMDTQIPENDEPIKLHEASTITSTPEGQEGKPKQSPSDGRGPQHNKSYSKRRASRDRKRRNRRKPKSKKKR